MGLARLSALVLLSIIVTACGGGGGGSSDDAPAGGSSSSSSGSGSTSSSSGSGSSSSGSSSGSASDAPVATILFPWKVSRTEDGSILVRGVARDTDGVRSVKVNGVAATLKANTSPKTVHSSAVSSFQSTSSMQASDSNEVEWEVNLPLAEVASTILVVSTEDNSGNVNDEAGVAEVIQRKVPTLFALDTDRRLMVGQVEGDQLIRYGLDDNSYSPIDVPYLGTCDALTFLSSEDQVVCGQVRGSWLTLSSISLETGVKSQLEILNLDFDSAEWLFVHLNKIEITEDETSLYLLLKYFSAEDYSQNKSVIVRYDFASESFITIVDGQAADKQRLASDDMTLSHDGLLVFSEFWGGWDDSLRKLAVDGSVISDVAPSSSLFLAGIAVDSASTTAFMVGYDGIVKADLESGTVSTLSLETEEPIFNINQIRSVGLDEANNRLLIADSDFDYVLAVNTQTGARSEFAGNGVGSGKRLSTPRGIALDESAGKAYLLEDAYNGGYLFEVDLENGNRRVLSKFDFNCHQISEEVVRDQARNRLYAVYANDIFSVNPEDGTWTRLVGGNAPGADCEVNLFAFTGATLDTESNRLLVTDAYANGVLTVDLATGAVDTLLQSAEELPTPVDVALDSERGALYILDQEVGDLFHYDLESRSLTSMLGGCRNAPISQGIAPDHSTAQDLLLDRSSGSLWVVSDNLARADLAGDVCTAESRQVPHGVFNLDVTSEGQLLGTFFNELKQLDFESGNYVIISK
ncbi:hypothetical protein GNX18_06785 [Microbulbifer sp. SH-1]|uniref:hypothetical protein n=1 Tax=Microbulbifer sp. SH-1 TaxID=2681547 RepID=UPI00140D2A5A|nr:hypothetical protein [Microbulbifer sp. SH-1]QIL89495.1 hypothetical protein GNX18_06785 [Microbulbifer sp. SH-1]